MRGRGRPVSWNLPLRTIFQKLVGTLAKKVPISLDREQLVAQPAQFLASFTRQ
jgi:hypothetical protein